MGYSLEPRSVNTFWKRHLEKPVPLHFCCVIVVAMLSKNLIEGQRYFTATTCMEINSPYWGQSQERKRSDSENISLIHHSEKVLHLF